MNKLVVTDADIRAYTNSIIRQITLARIPRFDFVIGIARGGLVPANLLSQYYDVPLVTVSWSLRDHTQQDHTALAGIAGMIGSGHSALLVDDICDGGHTFRDIVQEIRTHSNSSAATLVTAALIHNEGEDLFAPDFVGHAINKRENDQWVVFPWESWWTS